ncbi:MAG TPA: Arc family DNA-binding protein [Aldersonia sp.]
MATLTIRDFDDELKAALRVRAAEHGRSMEAEVREILRATLTRPSPSDLGMGTRIRQRFSGGENADIELPARSERPRAPELPG